MKVEESDKEYNEDVESLCQSDLSFGIHEERNEDKEWTPDNMREGKRLLKVIN